MLHAFIHNVKFILIDNRYIITFSITSDVNHKRIELTVLRSAAKTVIFNGKQSNVKINKNKNFVLNKYK